jgi:flagellar motor switch protein FliM
MTPVPFDFRKPPPGELGRQATGWLTAACRRAGASWARHLPFPATLALGHVEVVGAATALAALPEDALAVPLTAQDPADGTALLVFRRPVLLTLLAGLVGETPAALPGDRDATELELSLVGYLVRELFLDPLERAWPAPDPPQLNPGTPAPPRLAWAGEPADLILFATLDTTTPLGEYPAYVLLPRTGLGARLAAAQTRAPAPAPPPPAAHIEALVREMTVDLTVLLGTADLSMQQIDGLRTGDVVVLRQKVDQPLDGLLSGARKFRVWPGTIGAHAAVLIDAPAHDD